MNEPPIFLSWKDPEPPAKNDKEKSIWKNHLDPLSLPPFLQLPMEVGALCCRTWDTITTLDLCDPPGQCSLPGSLSPYPTHSPPIKSGIDCKRTCRNNNRLYTQPLWMNLEMNTLWCFKSVPDLCSTWLFAVLGFTGFPPDKVKHSTPVTILNLPFNPDLKLWPWPLTLT